MTGADAVRLHLTLALGLTICIGAFCIEVLRALGGNKLSWLYVFEWPLLGGFGTYMWWMLFTGRDRRRPSPGDGETVRPARTGDADLAKLEAWQRYLRQIGETETDRQHDS